MKRRDFIVGSVGTVGTLVPMLGLAQQATPCPPSLLQVEGGSSATTNCEPSNQAEGDIFTASYVSDRGNWDSEAGLEREGQTMQQALVPGGGPGGRPAFEIRQLVNSAGEFYQGHVKTLPSFGSGVSRFYRFRLWHDPANNYRASGGRTINKLLILGSSGGNGSRMILNANGFRDGAFAFEIIFDGWSSAPPETQPLAKGVWHSVQLEARWGSNAYINVWVDRDTYASPTIRLAGGTFNHTPMPGYTHFGAYSNKGLESGGVHNFRHADFRVGTAFDSNWHSSI
jgi:hypothetical protein